jgi:hypothetical protein
MLRRVALVVTDVSEELTPSFIRVTTISELGTTLPVTSVVPNHPDEGDAEFLRNVGSYKRHGVTSRKTLFFTVTQPLHRGMVLNRRTLSSGMLLFDRDPQSCFRLAITAMSVEIFDEQAHELFLRCTTPCPARYDASAEVKKKGLKILDLN